MPDTPLAIIMNTITQQAGCQSREIASDLRLGYHIKALEISPLVLPTAFPRR